MAAIDSKGEKLFILLFLLIITNVIVNELAFYCIDFGQDDSLKAFSAFFKKVKGFYVSYLTNIFIIPIKTFSIAILLSLGAFFYDIKLKFKEFWISTIVAEYIFLISSIAEVGWFYFKNEYSIKEVQTFYPLSIINFFNYNEIDLFLIYPLQQLNLFQIVNWGILIFLINKQLRKKNEKRLGYKLVLLIYLPVWILWMLSILLLNLTSSV